MKLKFYNLKQSNMKSDSYMHAWKTKMIFVFVVTSLLMIQCNESNEEKSAGQQTIYSDSTFMPAIQITIPGAPGADAFKENCMTCHSARYVAMQPGFPRKTWEKIVDKMVKNYGAHISDSTAKSIVDYLATVKENK
jgi:cytochrome c5